MCLYCGEEIGGPSVVQEKEALADTPQGCSAKLIRTGDTLVNTVGKVLPM